MRLSSLASEVRVQEGDAVLFDLDVPALRFESRRGDRDVVRSWRDIDLEAPVVRVQRPIARFDLDLGPDADAFERADQTADLATRQLALERQRHRRRRSVGE